MCQGKTRTEFLKAADALKRNGGWVRKTKVIVFNEVPGIPGKDDDSAVLIPVEKTIYGKVRSIKTGNTGLVLGKSGSIKNRACVYVRWDKKSLGEGSAYTDMLEVVK